MPHGYTDAAANLIPVVPAFHSRALLPDVENKPKPRKLSKNRYDQVLLEESLDREIPKDHEGLVFFAQYGPGRKYLVGPVFK